jgi:hypothetical protein
VLILKVSAHNIRLKKVFIISQVLVDEKAFNQLLYAVKFHIDLIKTDSFFAKDDSNLIKMRESINKMNEAIEQFDSPLKTIKHLKRSAYTKYLESKKALISARNLNDPDLIVYCEGINKKDLETYIKVKAACESLVRENDFKK